MVGSNRSIRGGSYNNPARNLRSAYRNNNNVSNYNNNIGARLALFPSTQQFTALVPSFIPALEIGKRKDNGLLVTRLRKLARIKKARNFFLALTLNPQTLASLTTIPKLFQSTNLLLGSTHNKQYQIMFQSTDQ